MGNGFEWSLISTIIGGLDLNVWAATGLMELEIESDSVYCYIS